MQIGIRLHDTVTGTLDKKLQTIKEQGFSCAHVALSKVFPELITDYGALTPGFAMYIKRLFAKYELDIAVLGCYLNLANPDQLQLHKNMDYYLANIRFASLLGCGVVGTETGAPNVDYTFEPACYSEEALKVFINNLKEVVHYAECMGVIVAIEPVKSHIVYDAKRALRVLEEIHSPNLQIIFDPVNLLDAENYMQQADIIHEALELLGNEIAIIHMKDFTIEKGKFVSTAPGLGLLDYRPIIQYIKENKPMIQCTLEETVPDNAIYCREYIERI